MIEQVRQSLLTSDASYKQLAVDTGVPRSTLHRIATETNNSFRHVTIEKLFNYFKNKSEAA